MKKNGRKKTNLPLKNSIKNPAKSVAVVEKSKKKNRIFAFFTSIYGYITIVATIVSAFYLKDPIRRSLMSDQEIYQEDNFLTGILLPKKLVSENQEVDFKYGTVAQGYDIGILKRGVDIRPLMITLDKDDAFNMRFQLRDDNRLYLSTELYDFDKNEFVASLQYNYLTIFKSNFLNYYQTDSSLEILDKGERIICNVLFKQPNIVLIQGYWSNKNYTAVFDSAGLFGRHKSRAADIEAILAHIKAIKPIHFFKK